MPRRGEQTDIQLSQASAFTPLWPVKELQRFQLLLDALHVDNTKPSMFSGWGQSSGRFDFKGVKPDLFVK